MVFSRKAEFRGFGAICGGLAASCDLILALERRAKQGRLSRFRYSGAAAVLSRRPERHREGISCARRHPARFVCHAERRRAVAEPRNATDRIEARGEGLDFSANAWYLITPSYWFGVTPLLVASKPCRRLPLLSASRLADGLVSPFHRLSSFRGENLTFVISGVDYMALFENAPIPRRG